VIRFKTPLEGVITFNDMIKGPISVANAELDDLVIVRGDGVPTYNFGVVVDDWDMRISHVIRGDDHVNNTPRQINILHALGAPIPTYAHVPMILGNDGERLSKRHGAVSVLQYRDEGFLPETLLNYLARLGWSHGDDEKFDLAQFVEWFDLGHVSHSAARFDGSKLAWLSQQYLKEADNTRLAELVQPFLNAQNIDTTGSAALAGLIGLVKERVNTVAELADGLHIYYRQSLATAEELRAKLPKTALPALLAHALRGFAGRLRWHCHFMQKLEDEPSIEFDNFARVFDGLREGDFNAAHFAAWCEGRTGYPMVDACMRSLVATGWLNFRMRAMLVSFASYHLWLHWRPTGLFLARQFLDYEPGIHWSQMQMQSGTTGINTLRMYSPTKQAKDQDPQGHFIRRWVPELARVPLPYLAEPWKMDVSVQHMAGCTIGVDYPAPIVDDKVAMKAAKDRMYGLRQSPAARKPASPSPQGDLFA
jgi:hypothetical protein